ncbi:hypothetical protein M422DRAFT_254185 [Sphaerobolus stellatus SS14]|uniref:Unplaced genomic scaffold SPHSTscaffold_53, whole genome shotgun sequence n=1 Tax=Sphaerobolus stellatus (strain SS14) TaxID=990650 RepID=A0A0C9VVM3_SPHS4|nr:hypothetical protein M422DRAFT_254185 [Sphaerobolus stellatus SS14]
MIREKYPTIAKGKSSIHSKDPTRDPNNEELDPHSEQPTHWLNNQVNEESTNDQPNVDPKLIQTTPRPNNRSGTKHALSKTQTEFSAKTAILEQLYADQTPADHLNQAAMAARNTHMEYEQILRLSKNPRVDGRWENPHKSVQYAPFGGIEDNDTDSETTVRNHREGSVPFQHLDYRDILDMSISKSDNALSPLAKAGVKVTSPNKYSGEQCFEALKTFVSFLGTRLEGKALKWFNKTVEPRKYQGTPMDLEQVMTGLYGQYIPSLARREASNQFDLIKQGMLSGNSKPTTSNSQQDGNVLSHTRHKPRNNGPDRTKSHTNPPKLGEISKGPSITPGRSGVNRNSLTAPGRSGPPIHNRQQMNHKSSHNSIECYNCDKSGHIKPNCPEPLRAHHVGAVHVEDSPAGQVDNDDLDINDNIDDECPDEDKYCNDDYDNQLDLSEDQHSWGSKPSEFEWSDDEQTHRVNSDRYSHDLARIAAVTPIGPANARKAKIAKEGEPLYDHTVKMKTTRPAWSKHDPLTITGYFLVGGTKAHCLFNSGCEGIIMSSEFV